MAEKITEYYHELYVMNLILLERGKQGQWEGFSKLVEDYVVKIMDIANQNISDLTPTEKVELKIIISHMVDNEAEMVKMLNGRLDALKQHSALLQHGMKCSQIYSLQQIASFH